MLGRRFLLLVAVLMGLTALAASVAPRDPAVRDDGRRATPTPSATSTEPAGPATTRTIEREISADAERPQRVVVDLGDIVELEVASSEIDSVVLMDEVEPVEPESNARFNVLADEVATHEIRLLDADRVIGTLEVREAS
jgi:hypothetical protein